MNKILIFLTVTAILITAIIETKDLLTYLENRSAYSKTPAQIEMSAPLNRKNIESKSIKFQENTHNMHDKFRKENQKTQQKNNFDLHNNMNQKAK